MKLIKIPEANYPQYRLDVIFDGFKWDPQFVDNNTIAKHVLVMTQKEHQQIQQYVQQLTIETINAENYLNQHLSVSKKLKLNRKIRHELTAMKNYDANKHIRLMRFDFHPTIDGSWAISEVNSDVPGGFAESSYMPQIAINHINPGSYDFVNFQNILIQAIQRKVPFGSKIMLVHCTSYSDDRQVMQSLGTQLETLGYNVLYGAADHLKFINHQAYSILDQHVGPIDAIVRFNPMEWVVDIKPKNWQGYFNTITPSCNHPISVFAQSKRFPLLWDALEAKGIELTTWRNLLPKTIEVKDVKLQQGFIYKPVWGRVGEGISIEEACKEDEYQKILKDVKRRPHQYIAQQRFSSQPLIDDEGNHYHVCLGAYSVDGQAAGYYARLSTTPRIDSYAADIPVIIEGERNEQ